VPVSHLTKLIYLHNANKINVKWSFVVRDNGVFSFAVRVMYIFTLRLNYVYYCLDGVQIESLFLLFFK